MRSIAVFVALATVTAFGYQSSPANRPWPPGVQKVPDESPALSPADALKTFYMPPGYHLELVASEPLDPGAGRDRLGSRRTAVGGRDARLHGGPHRLERTRSDRPRRRARGHERRRHDGQAHGVRGRPGARAVAEGARSRRARRRAAQRLADARHQRRSARWTRRSSSPNQYGRRDGAIRRTTRTASTGRSTTGCTRPDSRHPAPAEERQVRGPEDAARAASGA